MTLYPNKFDGKIFGEGCISEPEVFIFFAAFKICFDPVVEPFFFYTVYNVLAISKNSNGNVFFGNGHKCLNHTHEFHAVVGGVFVTTPKLFYFISPN